MYICAVVTRPALRAFGMKVRTSAANAPRDCAKLWHEDFGPRMPALMPAEGSECYGISVMADLPAVDGAGCSFDYYAALPLAEGRAAPAGMERVDVPEGLYLECLVPSMEHIGAAYRHMYEQWLPGHPEFTPLLTAACYELYPRDFMEKGNFAIYSPLAKAR